MIGSELYKLYIKRKFLLILAVVFAVKAISVCVAFDNSLELDEASRAVYKTCIGNYGGDLTDEKIDKIENEAYIRHEYEVQKTQVTEKFAKGEISKNEFKSAIDSLEEKLKGSDGFTMFYNQYISVYDSEEPYLADMSLWNVLFGSGEIDFFAVFLILLAVVLLTVNDEETGINRLKFAALKGKGSLVLSQIFIIALTSVIIAFAIYFGKYFIAEYFYSLDGKEISLNTLELFEFSTYKVSLGKAYFYLSGFKILGCVYLAFFAMLVGQLLKSSLYTFFVCLMSVYMPEYVLSGIRNRFLLPLISSLMSANNYFSATGLDGIVIAEDDSFYIAEFSKEQLITVFAVCCVITVLLIVLNVFLWIKRRNFKE